MAIVDIVKYNGPSDIFAWKHPSEELGTWTQVIVNESQEAILYKSGKALDTYPSGRHTLSADNIPLLNNLINLPFGTQSPFKAEIWYINKTHSLDVKWGTPSPIQLQDPKYNVFITLRAFGQFGIQIEDSRKFLIKLVGTLPSFSKKDILSYFRGMYLTKVKDTLSSYLINQKISILEINSHLNDISDFLKKDISQELKSYGIKLLNFYVNDINVPEEDDTVKKLKIALSKKAEMDIIGYDYSQERTFNTLEGAASNEGSTASGLMGTGIGLGMGVELGQTIGSQFDNISSPLNTSQRICPKCHTRMHGDSVYCRKCGHHTAKVTAGEEQVSFPSCPACGTEITIDHAKFCFECGQSLINTCVNCHVTLNKNVKFCPECGTKQ